MANIEKLTIVDAGGTGGGATKVSKYLTELMATAPEMLKTVSGLDLEKIISGLVTPKGITKETAEVVLNPTDTTVA